MTGILHLDTHVIVWLAAGEHDRIPNAVLGRLQTDSLRISPIVRLELAYLRDKGRINAPPEAVTANLASSIGLMEDATPFNQVISEAIASSHRWHNRDPFDRIIAATAMAAGAMLATKDALLRETFPTLTIWD